MADTQKLNEEALKMHADNHGKLETHCKVPLEDGHDLAIAYTPGVAAPCLKIKDNPELSFEYTWRGNVVAVITDGTRVLGMGDIGPEAAMPVMEGKSVLYKKFGDIDSIPICIDTKDPEEFVNIVEKLQPSFGGVNLEDISSPKCYQIEAELIKRCHIPIFHDDQHGTAIIACAAVMGALRYVKKDISAVKCVVNGCGAAGSAIGKLLYHLGVKDLIMIDSKGAIYEGRPGSMDMAKAYLAGVSNKGMYKGDLAGAVKGADVLIGVSKPGAITQDMIRTMAEKPIVFAIANPVPEISYEDAKAAGAAVVGTGRSDAPNQVNNVCVFPGMFRGALDVRSSAITEEMKVAAVHAIAGLIKDEDLREDYIVPDAFDRRIVPEVAAAVAKVAMDQGIARIKRDPEDIKREAAARIDRNWNA
jgi:malate dehydrogenase (oxaloacetate-decarboxylating)